jgi:hypothetical protein
MNAKPPEDYEAKLRAARLKPLPMSPADLPSRFDWTDSAAVSPAVDQLCGDCWAVSAIGALESMIRIYDGDTTRLSIQQAIDCNYAGETCWSGGNAPQVYDMYRLVGGVSEACYLYTGVDGDCAADTCDFDVRIDGWEFIDTSLVSLKTHIMTYGPIAAGMGVTDLPAYRAYTGGCYEDANATPTHLHLIVGWDDTLCAGAGAWHVKETAGVDWGESGFGWIKYGCCSVGAWASIVHYTPRERAKLVYESCMIDDSSGDNDGRPDAGETITLPVSLTNKRWETATGVSAVLTTTSAGITILTAAAAFPSVAPGATEQSDPPHFAFSIDPEVACGERISFVISVTCDQGVFTDILEMLVGTVETVFFDDVEADLGWSLGAAGDDATLGQWIRGVPKGSAQGDSIFETDAMGDTMIVQSELDCTPGSGAMAFFTANAGRGKPVNHRDVDGGKTTLLSPVLDLSDYTSALLRYWRWYTNDTDSGIAPDDTWLVDISPDSGETWVSLENESSSAREWMGMEFDIGSYISLTDRVMLRFIASDYGQENTVEALVDDIEITGCPLAARIDDEDRGTAPDEVTLLKLERNPFTHSTHIFFAVPRKLRARVRIYDARGRLIQDLLDSEVEQGYHSLVWGARTASGRQASAGVYFVRLEAGGEVRTAKAILSR